MSLLLLRFEFWALFFFYTILIKVLPVTTHSCYLFLGINNTGPLISNIHMHILYLHDVCGLDNLCLPSVTPQDFLPLLQPRPFVATVYSSGTPLGSRAGKNASPEQETMGDWFLSWMICFTVAAQKLILSPITFNWRSPLWNVCTD